MVEEVAEEEEEEEEDSVTVVIDNKVEVEIESQEKAIGPVMGKNKVFFLQHFDSYQHAN